MQRNGRSLTFLTAGGTIDKIYGMEKETVNYSFRKIPAVIEIAQRMQYGYGKIPPRVSLPPLDGHLMESDDLTNVASLCKSIKTEAILVTIGTDAMINAGAYIAALNLEKVIVITGASQPASQSKSDADANVGFALGLINTIQAPGVYIAMHGRWFSWDECEKTEAGHFVRKRHH